MILLEQTVVHMTLSEQAVVHDPAASGYRD